MMQKTLKKTKTESKDNIRKSYIVTESGLVESGENIDKDRRPSLTNNKTLLSFIGVEDAKRKLKSLAERRRSMALENQEEKKSKVKFTKPLNDKLIP